MTKTMRSTRKKGDEYYDFEAGSLVSSSSSKDLKAPLKQYSSPDRVSGRKIKRMQKTHSVPVLFSNSPEMLSSSSSSLYASQEESARRYFEKFELDWNQTLIDACSKGNATLVSKLLRDPTTVAINTSLMKGKNLLAIAFKNYSDSGSWLDVVAVLLTGFKPFLLLVLALMCIACPL